MVLLRSGMRRMAQMWMVSRTAVSGPQAELIRALRQRTGAPMKDVKEVLEKCKWDHDTAFTELRKRGLALASKRAFCLAADGLFGVSHFDKGAAIVEINSETDFVAKNELFQSLVIEVSKAAATIQPLVDYPKPVYLDVAQIEDMNINMEHTTIRKKLSVRDAVDQVGAIVRENIKFRRAFQYVSPRGTVSSYLHMSPRKGVCRVAGLVALEVDPELAPTKDVDIIGGKVAMQVVAMDPLYLTRADADPSRVEQERNILQAQTSGLGKPANIVDKVVTGRMNKFFEDAILLEQKYIADETKTVQGLLDEHSKSLGKPVKVVSFLRIEIGEGIEKTEKNFAEEVAAAAARS